MRKPGFWTRPDQVLGLACVLVFLQAMLLGFVIAIITCYHGLAQPLRLEQVSQVTVRAVTQGVVIPILIDGFFIVFYLLA